MRQIISIISAAVIALPIVTTATTANAGWGSFVDSLKVFSDKETWKKRGIMGGCVFVGNAAKGCPDQAVKDNFRECLDEC